MKPAPSFPDSRPGTKSCPGLDAMIVDLHAHYPMQFTADSMLDPMTDPKRPAFGDRIRAEVLRFAIRNAGYENSAGPGVTVSALKAGRVGVALSVLLSPFSEIDLSKKYGAPPDPRYVEDLLRLMKD